MARRLNTRFLTILLLVVAALGGSIILAERFLIHEHPDRYIQLGKQAMKDHKWQEAVANFSRAGNLSPRDPQIQMMLGAALEQVVQDDPQAVQMEVGAYQKALEIDPKYLPALKALSDLFIKEANRDPAAYLYTSAIDYTRQARDVDPSDEKLQSLVDKLIIQQWSSGLSTDQKPVDDAVKEMKALWIKYPADADLPFSIASAEIEEGMKTASQNPDGEQLQEVTDRYKNAVATFETVLTGPKGGSQSQNAAMHFGFARVLEQLSNVDQSSPDLLKKDQDQASQEIELARKLVKPGDTEYLDINDTAADFAMRRGDRAAAIAIYKSMPRSPRTEISLADVLSRSLDTQAEAVTLLKNTLASLGDDPNHVIFYGARFLTTLELTKVQVFLYLEMPASSQKQKAHDDIRTTLDKLNQVAGIRTFLPLKEVEARFEIGSGLEEEMQEIQTLSKLMADNPPSTKEYYWYTLQTLLAQGYEDTNQTSKALEIFRDVVQQFPRDIAAREHLIRLLLIEQPDQARPHIVELARLNPGDPALNLYRIQLLLSDPEKNKDAIQKFYSNLKENNVNVMSAKARVAMRIKDYDDAIRLFKIVTEKAPTRVDDWVMLSRLQFMLDKKDDALDTATRGLAANPSDPQLRLLIPRMKGESSKVIEDLQVELAKENPDKSQGEVALAAMANRRGDSDEEGAHLEAAAKISPESPHIQDLLFNYYIRTKKFDLAAKCVPVLASSDADQAGGELYRLSLAEARGDNATSESIARGLTQNKPEFARSWLAMGDVLQNEGRFDEAIPQYNNCLQRESSLAEAYVGLARCYYGLHRDDDALHTIEDGLNRLPDDPTLSQMKLSHEIEYGQPQEAIKELKEEIIVHPNQPRLYAALGNATLRYCDLLGKNHQLDDVAKQAQQGITMLTDPLAKWPDESELYLVMSECQVAANLGNDALKTLETWAQRPAWIKQPEPYLAMSELYERFGFHDKAEEQMQTAMARSGYRVDLQLRMASLLAVHQKYGDALSLLRSVNTDRPEIQERIVQILLVSGKFDEAQSELKDDLSRNPPNAQRLLATWALALYEHRMYPEAADRATQALAITPNDPTSLFCRARAELYERPPHADAALQDLQKVRQASPDNIEVRLTLSDAYIMLNRSEEAINELEAGVRALPSNKDLRMKLVDLYANGAHPRLSAALKLLQDVDGVAPFNKDPDIFQNESVILAKMGNTDDALARAEVARQLAPDNVGIIRTEMQLLLSAQNFQGVFDRYAGLSGKMKSSSWALSDLAVAEKRTNNPQSLPDFNRAIAMAQREDQPLFLDSLARTIAQEFSYDDAVNSLLPISKDYVPARVSLARLYQVHGDDAAAISTVDGIMADLDKLNRRDQINFLSNAAVMYQLAKPVPLVDKAYDAYLAWLKLEPDNVEALNNMACLLADNYSPPRAQEGLKYANEAVSQMVQIGRTEPRMLDTQAWLMILNGSPEDGINILNKAMDDSEPFPEEYLHLGEGYLRKDSPDPVQAETQAKLGLQLVNRRNAGDADANIRAKLQDLINRSEETRHARQQAQVP
jgi:tetratricopeptide (TPR) repeat protein